MHIGSRRNLQSDINVTPLVDVCLVLLIIFMIVLPDTLIVRHDEVPAALARIHSGAASRPVAVRADKRVQYGDVATVLVALRAAGWEDVKLVSVAQDAQH